MSPLKDITSIAQSLVDELGPAGHLAIAERAAEHRRAGDHEAADLWSQVSRAMRALRPDPLRRPGAGS